MLTLSNPRLVAVNHRSLPRSQLTLSITLCLSLTLPRRRHSKSSVVVSSRKQNNVDEAVEKLKAQGIEVDDT
ncbi:hypothetical protein CMV_007702 [Castanea mollissima]|uniref:Uncharacterized protein n=1 Tax=Castanea mollissima TaxID=60419 RepID=A0A8J4RDQ8_9ROSI|nr:hypothetical protein CMV_007702 [Castanea mollissima]